MDKVNVICHEPECLKKKQVMTYSEFEIHSKQCIKMNTKCPLMCNSNINSIEDGNTHYDICPNKIIECIKCQDTYLNQNSKSHCCIRSLKRTFSMRETLHHNEIKQLTSREKHTNLQIDQLKKLIEQQEDAIKLLKIQTLPKINLKIKFTVDIINVKI